MNKKHLLWIIPVVLIIAISIVQSIPKEPYCYAFVGDPQGYYAPNQFPSLLTHIQAKGIEYVFILGDITENATHKEFQQYLSIISKYNMTFYHIAGNHDLLANKSLERYFQYFPFANWSLEIDNDLIIGLDNGDDQPLKKEELEWLEHLLETKNNKRAIVLVHIPLLPIGEHHEGYYINDEGILDEDFLQLLFASSNIIMITGHKPCWITNSNKRENHIKIQNTDFYISNCGIGAYYLEICGDDIQYVPKNDSLWALKKEVKP